MTTPLPATGPSPALLDAFWRVVAEHGWHGTTFARISAEGGGTLAELRARYATPADLLRAHAAHVDRQVLEGTVPGTGSAPRDRIFDVLMRRFDALQPHRDGILRFQRDMMRDPLSALLLSPLLMASMAWMLEAAEIDASGIRGGLRVQGLAGVWVAASRAWAEDDSVDLGGTMAALDRALDRAERVARTLRLDDGDLAAPLAGPEAGFAGVSEAQDLAGGGDSGLADGIAPDTRRDDPATGLPAGGVGEDAGVPGGIDVGPGSLGPDMPGEGGAPPPR